MEEYWNIKGWAVYVLVVFNEEEVIMDSFKHCAVAIPVDGSEDLLIHCPNTNHKAKPTLCS